MKEDHFLWKRKQNTLWIKALCLCPFLLTTPTEYVSAVPKQDAVSALLADRVVKGTIVDASGESIIGASVKVQNTTTGCITGMDGDFTISAPEGAKLEITYIGYITQVVSVPENGTLAITLKEDTKVLDEVVVVGYGTQKKAHLTGSVSTVDPKDIKDSPFTNVGAMLAGTVPGLNILGGDGRPGMGASITIRNAYSTGVSGSSTDPIFVIDGIIQQNNPRNGITGADAFNNLDPNEIESISILKDAAAAVYGARGAQGAVIVTTKRGNEDGTPRISYSGSVTVNDKISTPKMLNAYDYGRVWNGMKGAGGNAVVSDPKKDLFQADELEAMKGMDYDWLDEAWSPAFSTKHNVNISGGGKQSSYFGSVSYQTQEGNLSTLNYNRWNYRAGMNTTIANHLNVGLSVSGNYADRKTTFNKVGGSNDNNDYATLLTTPRYIPWSVQGDDGETLWLTRYGISNSKTNDLSLYNYYAIEDLANKAETKMQHMTINGSLEYDFDWLEMLKGLKLRFSYAKSIGNTEARQLGSKYDAYYFGTRGGSGNHLYIDEGAPDNNLTAPSNVKTQVVDNGHRILRDFDRTDNYQMNFQASYAREFGKHSISGLFAIEKREMNYEYSRLIKEDPLPGKLPNGETNTVTGDVSSSSETQRHESGDLSYIGRINYAYSDKYLFEFLIRSDASTKFSPDNYWGVFPSFSAGWVISQEPWFKVKGVDYLKIRASFGILGQDNTAAWLWRQRYTYQANYGPVLGTGTSNKLGWSLKTEAAPNYDAHWDKDYKYNLGFDARFLDSRLTANIDAYLDKRKDMLVTRAGVPVTVGAKSAAENYDAVDNYGIEISLGWRDHVGDFNYNVMVNGQWSDSRYRKKDWPAILAYNDIYPDGPTDMGVWGYDCIGMFRSQADIDKYVADNKITKYLGNSPEQIKPGMLIYRDVRGEQNQDGSYQPANGVVDEQDRIQLSKRTGNPYGCSFLLGGEWKGLSLNANISMSWGGYAEYEGNYLPGEEAMEYENAPAFWNDMYVPEDIVDNQGRVVAQQNLTAKYPNMGYGVNSETSNFWQVSAFRMYLRSLALGYSLPKKLINKTGMENCKFILSGTNLFSFSNPYNYTDPLTGYDAYPILRSLTLGVNLTF